MKSFSAGFSESHSEECKETDEPLGAELDVKDVTGAAAAPEPATAPGHAGAPLMFASDEIILRSVLLMYFK